MFITELIITGTYYQNFWWDHNDVTVISYSLLFTLIKLMNPWQVSLEIWRVENRQLK